MNSGKISGVMSVIGKEIADAEKKRQALLAEAVGIEETIAEMKQVLSGLESLFPDQKRKPAPSKKPGRPSRKKAAAPAAKATAVDAAVVLEVIASAGDRGAKHSVVNEQVGSRTGWTPSKKALSTALDTLLQVGAIRREGYRFVASGNSAAPEAAPADEEAPTVDDAPAGGDSGEMPLWQEPVEEVPEAPARRGRPRNPVSEDVARAMAEVFNVIQAAGNDGCKSSAIRGAVEEATGVPLSSAHTTRSLKDLLAEGRVRRDGYRYFAV